MNISEKTHIHWHKQLHTTNWRGSGQESLEKRLMATKRLLRSFPLYTTLGALSPLSDTMSSLLNPLVAARSSASPNSLKPGTPSLFSNSSPLSASTRNTQIWKSSKTVSKMWNGKWEKVTWIWGGLRKRRVLVWGGEVGGFGLKAAHERVLHVEYIHTKIQVYIWELFVRLQWILSDWSVKGKCRRKQKKKRQSQEECGDWKVGRLCLWEMN